MKKYIFLIFAFLFVNNVLSQQKALRIVSKSNNKVIIIEDLKRIRIKTTEGKKVSGKFQIIDSNTIFLKGKEYVFSDIEKIKKNPIIATVLTDVGVLYVGLGFTLFVALAVEPVTGLILGTTALSYSLIKSSNLLKGYKTKEFTIETIGL